MSYFSHLSVCIEKSDAVKKYRPNLVPVNLTWSQKRPTFVRSKNCLQALTLKREIIEKP